MAMTRQERARFDGVFPLDGTEYFPPPMPLIEGLIPKNEFTLLTGQPKVGKSTFAAHLAYSVATGEPFFDREVRQQGAVIYIAMERAYQTQQRINKLFELGEHRQENIILVKPQESSMKSLFFNSDNQGDVHKLIARIDQAQVSNIQLIVVDSLENTLIGSDSDSKDAGPWCDGLQTLLEHYETTGLVLHHETKASEGDGNSKTAYRGSSVLLARAGAWLRAIGRAKNTVELKAHANNFGAEWSDRVGFNDFGLYTQSMPELAKDKRPSLTEFVKARLMQNPKVTPARLAELVRQHPDSAWRNVEADRITKAVKELGDAVVKHPNPNDGRSKLLEWVG